MKKFLILFILLIILSTSVSAEFNKPTNNITTRSHGEMFINNSVTATVISAQDETHLVDGYSVGNLENMTFDAGENGTITAVADAGGGDITVTATNTLSNGDNISITGTTNYDDLYAVSNVSGSAFDVTVAFVATDTGFYQAGSALTVEEAGEYLGVVTASTNVTVGTIAITFSFIVNNTIIVGSTSERDLTASFGTISGISVLSLNVGDTICFGLVNIDDTTNLTIRYSNFSLIKL